jgi:hypothetical protein
VLAAPAFAKNVENAEPETVEFQVTDPKQDSEFQTQGALPIYALATLQMKKVDNVVRTYASTYTPIKLKLKTECWLNAKIGGRWAMLKYNIDTQDLANASTVNLDDVSYNSGYEYKADSCHTTFDASTGYTGVAWLQDTTL